MVPLQEAVLGDCVRKSPGTTSRIESLGLALAGFVHVPESRGITLAEGKKRWYWELAREAFKAALTLGSEREGILMFAAVADERLGDFAGARDKLTHSLSKLERTRPANGVALCHRYHARAHVLVRLAEQHQSSPNRPAPKAVRSLYEDALADLDRARPWIESQNSAEAHVNDSIRVGAEIALGDLEVQTRHLTEALVHLERAQVFLSRLDMESLRSLPEYERLSKKLAALAVRVESLRRHAWVTTR
jgi:hypothetical protein